MPQNNGPAANRNRRTRGAIHVCPLSAVPDTVAQSKASHLLTWVQKELMVETPRLIRPDRHIYFHINDIAEPIEDRIAPAAEHIDQLIEFARDWAGEGPIVVHCWAGISRSPAAAYIALCTINPDASEELIAKRLRAASPTAYPNRLMIRLGDAALGRQGRMVRAVESIGRGVVAVEAKPFSLPSGGYGRNAQAAMTHPENRDADVVPESSIDQSSRHEHQHEDSRQRQAAAHEIEARIE